MSGKLGKQRAEQPGLQAEQTGHQILSRMEQFVPHGTLAVKWDPIDENAKEPLVSLLVVAGPAQALSCLFPSCVVSELRFLCKPLLKRLPRKLPPPPEHRPDIDPKAETPGCCL